MPSLNPLAVIAGCAVDQGFTLAVSAALPAFFAHVLGADRATATASVEFLLPLVTLAALGTVFGGAVAARFARKDPLAHGLAVGGVSVALGLVAVLSSVSLPAPWGWLQLVAAPPAGLLGGLLGSPRS
jgi:hypothetical protein